MCVVLYLGKRHAMLIIDVYNKLGTFCFDSPHEKRQRFDY